MNETTSSHCDSIDWFFDFISPYAYLQHEQLKRHYGDCSINYRPILFAGLLKHWSHLGPAEIPQKRIMTYQYCHWSAKKQGIPYKTPPSHPFNPLPLLRLCVSQRNAPNVVSGIFNAIWGQGMDLSAPGNMDRLCEELKIDAPQEKISEQWVKDELRDNTERAIDLGLFGVPTILAGGKLFWGCDMTEMAMAHLETPTLFSSGEYQRLEALPEAKTRT
ncbi:MAG: 2-hydroxychromene-2-carboxylate isomerase [Gammaproteobacteria bacterium]|nr:2-hydroxychromene-2-carboxylate isomerase [Gammaproteobacteria bacterium]NKB62769.1 2-hydroxychromene-2-carboxylate isomerase [Gammaproteobacteria bacterium]